MTNPPKLSASERQYLNIFLNQQKPISVNELVIIVKKSKRMVYYDLATLDFQLNQSDIGSVYCDNAGYFLSDRQKAAIKDLLASFDLQMTKDERISYLACFILSSTARITMDQIVEMMAVSKNSVLRDLNKIRELFAKYQLELISSKENGYVTQGDTYRKRSCFLTCLRKLLKTVDYKKLSFFNINLIEQFSILFNDAFNKLEIEVDKNEIILMSFLLMNLKNAPIVYNYDKSDMQFVSSSKELQVVDEYFSILPPHERIYLAIHLIGYREDKKMNQSENNLLLLDLASELVNTFESISCLSFCDKEKLINSVYLHMQLSNYQYVFSIPTSNPLLEDIKESYGDIYMIAKMCCEKLEDKFPYPILESEISFLSMHFAANLRKGEAESNYANVLLVCLNSTASSLLLKNEVESTFNNINIVSIVKPSESLKEWDVKIDFVISTIKFDCRFPLILVNPVLSIKDKSTILSILMMLNIKSNSSQLQLKPILNIIRNNVKNPQLYRKIYDEIDDFYHKGGLILDTNEENTDQFIPLLQLFGIKLDKNKRMDWENAIREVSQPMLERKYIESRYISMMIELVQKYGPYIVVSSKIAIAHAQPNDGAKRLGLSLGIFSQGLTIKDKTVYLLFVLSTTNQEEHLHLLNNILLIDQNNELVEQLLASEEPNSAVEILETYLGSGKRQGFQQ